MGRLAKKIKLLSPAKLNLFLRILKRREDGYHEIASLFQTVGLCDTITIELAQKDRLAISNRGIPCDETNLILKAVNLFREKTGLDFGVRIFVEKKIPVKAGLGGGSSNAATALWGINRLLKSAFTDRQLADWGAEIGSDVPFFFSKGTAYCSGRGEAVEEKEGVNLENCWIAKPDFGMSTPCVYRELDLTSLRKRDLLKILEGFERKSPFYFNDLEEAAMKIQPRLLLFKKKLALLGLKKICLTGSGSAFFCFSESFADSIKDFFILPVKSIFRSRVSWYC